MFTQLVRVSRMGAHLRWLFLRLRFGCVSSSSLPSSQSEIVSPGRAWRFFVLFFFFFQPGTHQSFPDPG